MGGGGGDFCLSQLTAGFLCDQMGKGEKYTGPTCVKAPNDLHRMRTWEFWRDLSRSHEFVTARVPVRFADATTQLLSVPHFRHGR